MQYTEKLWLDNELFKIENGELIYIKKILPKIVIPEGVETISASLFGGMSMEEQSEIYRTNQKIQEVVFPSTLKRIENGAFDQGYGIHGFFALKNIKLPPSVKKIGDNAFSQPTDIETIELYDNAEIGRHAFVLSKEFNRPKMLIHKLPKKIIINYTNFVGLAKILDQFINSQHFTFDKKNRPEFEFELKGPKLSKIETLKIYKKMFSIHASKFYLINQKIDLELPKEPVNDNINYEEQGRHKK